jgi:hypothetical protein
MQRTVIMIFVLGCILSPLTEAQPRQVAANATQLFDKQ